MSEIKIMTHDNESKRDLFGLIGEACASVAVHRHLGAPIVSTAGCVWIVSIGSNGEMEGMCGLSLLKSKASIKLHGLYAGDNAPLLKKLRKEACKQAKKMGAGEIVATDLTSLKEVYEQEGWQAVAPRGKNYLAYRKEV